MKTWETTNILEQQEIQHLGEEFLSAHKEHVALICKEEKVAIEPSGSDLFNPKLWKPIHWNWFFETFNVPVPKISKPSIWSKILAKILPLSE